MATPTAFAFSLADFIGAQIEARIADLTIDAATVSISEELVSDAADCPAAEGVLIRVVPTEQEFTRTDRAQSLEDRATLVVQCCLVPVGDPTQAKKRKPGNYAAQILRHFAHRDRAIISSLDAVFIDNESELVTLFEDDIFRALGVVMAAITLTYRQQNATT